MMAILSVLKDDNLLSEILLCVSFRTSLLYAALVSRRWLRLASDPVFLRRFRDLHPPSLLGFYVNTRATKPPRFVSMPLPPELAAVVRRANFDLGNLGSNSFALSSSSPPTRGTGNQKEQSATRCTLRGMRPFSRQFRKPASMAMSSHATKKRSSPTAAAMASSFRHLARRAANNCGCVCVTR
ncbi:hypothetical protein ZWY2020_000773 [Hordeum vulgare]|nr:hypothetical protein ZWY2020_000773 [Hordeum vulgare]